MGGKKSITLTNPPCGSGYKNQRPKNMPADRASYMVGRTDKRNKKVLWTTHGLWVSHPHPAFFCRRVDYMLGSLDSNRSVPSPKFLVVPFRRGSLQNGTTRLYIGCPLHYFGDRGHVPLWLSERAKRWRQDGGACPCAVSCWWYLCFCFRFLFFLSAYVGDWYWIRSQGDVARALWWWRRRCINCYWSLFSLHTRAPHTTIWVCNRSLGRNNRRETQRPCVDHPNSAPYSDTLLNMVDAS